MRSLFITAVVLSVLGCKQAQNLLSDSTLNDKELSIFQTYSGQYCDLGSQSDPKASRVNCENLHLFLDPGSDQCESAVEKGLSFATFPHQGRRMSICRDLARPARAEQQNVRFLILGDVGVGQANNLGYQQRKVAEAMHAVCPPRESDKDNGCDFAIILGDLIYFNGVRDVFDPQFSEKFEQIYDMFGAFDIYVVPGNHDYAGNIGAQVEYTFFSERWRMLGRHYPIGDLPSWLSIYGLDTTPIVKSGATIDDQLASMRQSVCSGDATKIFFGHHPLLSHGKHGPESKMQSVLEQISQSCPFNFYLSGHDHHQEHISTESLELIVQGAGGAETNEVKKMPGVSNTHSFQGKESRYEQRYAKRAHGFSVIEADAAGVTVRFYDISSWQHIPGEGYPSGSSDDHVYSCRWEKAKPESGCVPQSADDSSWLQR